MMTVVISISVSSMGKGQRGSRLAVKGCPWMLLFRMCFWEDDQIAIKTQTPVRMPSIMILHTSPSQWKWKTKVPLHFCLVIFLIFLLNNLRTTIRFMEGSRCRIAEAWTTFLLARWQNIWPKQNLKAGGKNIWQTLINNKQYYLILLYFPSFFIQQKPGYSTCDLCPDSIIITI